MNKKKILVPIVAVAFVAIVVGCLYGAGVFSPSGEESSSAEPSKKRKVVNMNINGEIKEIDFSSTVVDSGMDLDAVKYIVENNVPQGEKKPKNAYYDKGFNLIPEKKGDIVDNDKLAGDILTQLAGNDSASINLDDYYKEAKITTESKEIKKIGKAINRYEDMRITYKFGKQKEVLDWTKLKKHVKYKKKKAKLVIDKKWPEQFVKHLAKKYNTFGKTRKFKTTKDGVKKIHGGILGWWIDEPATVTKLNKLLRKGKSKTVEPVYKNQAVKHGKDDIGDTYVEVSISRQHCWFYKKGKLKMQSNVVSGLDTPARRTTKGAHRIYAMQRERYLGTMAVQGYHTLVHYWMPFNWDGQGLHDATWRGRFGGNIYRYSGSHGCVNLPYSFARELYSKVKVGTPVIVY
ncbi:L,D-transpeptidase family protein [Eubacterium xylanophilum]|uniref:L,D-transpeptidase family protein n=1 Tax=Eubacterium xylanophilum TaxID=39497 RepID=UPI00047E35EC|nr:L,D-transpeptidase family protein [Eubacterium xylanophilum]